MSNALRTAEHIGGLSLRDIDWEWRVYLMRGELSEQIDHTHLFSQLREKALVIKDAYLSEEFEYLRSGFSIAHYGRRGVTYSFWHWADWQGTWEYLCPAWYCYGRALGDMEPLDRNEPLLCHHEIDVVVFEAVQFRSVALGCTDVEQVRNQYRAVNPYVAGSQRNESL